MQDTSHEWPGARPRRHACFYSCGVLHIAVANAVASLGPLVRYCWNLDIHACMPVQSNPLPPAKWIATTASDWMMPGDLELAVDELLMDAPGNKDVAQVHPASKNRKPRLDDERPPPCALRPCT